MNSPWLPHTPPEYRSPSIGSYAPKGYQAQPLPGASIWDWIKSLVMTPQFNATMGTKLSTKQGAEMGKKPDDTRIKLAGARTSGKDDTRWWQAPKPKKSPPPIMAAPQPQDNFSLDAILAALSGQQSPSIDQFIGPAQDIIQQNYAPQFAALEAMRNQMVGQYNQADPIVEGLYAQLQADLRNQANQTGTVYGEREAARQNQGDQLASQIGQDYANQAAQQAELFKSLGIEAALPAVSTDDAAWQQGQARNATQQQRDYLQTTGSGLQNYQNSLAAAQGNAGANARQDLIRQLSNQLASLQQQGLGLAGSAGQDATNLAMELMRNSRSSQGDMIGNLLQGYGLKQQAEQTRYNREQDWIDRELQAIEMSAAPEGLKFNELAPLDQARRQLASAYGNEGLTALNIAQQAAAGGYGTPAFTDAGSFVQHVTNAAQGAGVKNQAAILDAVNAVLPMLKLKGTGVI